jgi:hypothetical protein
MTPPKLCNGGNNAGRLAESVTARLARGNPGVRWLYNALDPISKFWLTFRLGKRGLGTVQSLVHQLVQRLVPGVIPLFLSNDERSFETGLLNHYGQWGQVENRRGQTRRRWLGLAEFAYVQAVKRRVSRH